MCSEWNQLIKKEVLTTKLLQRWTHFPPRLQLVGRAGENVTSLFCNDVHIFCGQENGLIGVYSMTGEWIGELVPGHSTMSKKRDIISHTLVAGSGGTVATLTWRRTLTLWRCSSRNGDISQISSFCRKNNRCQNDTCECHQHIYIPAIKVVDENKMIFVAEISSRPPHSCHASLMMTKRSNSGWETVLVIDSAYIALGCLGDYFYLTAKKKFCFGSARKDFPGWYDNSHHFDTDDLPLMRQDEHIRHSEKIILEPPFLISLKQGDLVVYNMDSNKPIKTIKQSEDKDRALIVSLDLIANDLVVAHKVCKLAPNDVSRDFNHIAIYDKKILLDPRVPADAVPIQKVYVDMDLVDKKMSMNTTSIVFARTSFSRKPVEKEIQVLNFWLKQEETDVQEKAGN